MVWKRQRGLLLEWSLAWSLLAGAAVTLGMAQSSTAITAPGLLTTTVSDTVYRADGTPASGTVLISWPAFGTAGGGDVPAGTTSVTIGPGGLLDVTLVPNAGSTPMGSYYTVVYHLDDGSVTREYWVIPAMPAGSTATVKLSAIKSTVLPASVAMQTVSKSYVDMAIAAAVTGTPLDSSPYVEKSGDTMTGPLVLPGDPTAPLQASDKNYVDEQVAGLTSGLAQKVSELPQATQTVTQPSGTQLQVNNLNGALYASQYQTGAGGNGIANAAASPDCANGCDLHAEATYQAGAAAGGLEQPLPTTWNNKTALKDDRQGMVQESYFNPLNLLTPGLNAGHTIDVRSTQTSPQVDAASNSQGQDSVGLVITQEGLTGGSNEYPKLLQGTVPYGKSTYTGMRVTGTNNTPGQHVLSSSFQNCYGVGDCLMGGLFMQTSGGFRDDADEGAHPFDLQFSEDANVFTGSCASGCTPGSTSMQVNATAGAGTQGEGRYLIDTNPADTITTGQIIGGDPNGPQQPTGLFSGTNFPVSVFLETAETIPTQADNIAPGTVNVPIVTSGEPAGYAGNTAALPTATGVACVSDQIVADGRPMNFETANYTVTDATHVQLVLRRPHGNGATIAVGGLCGYGLEQTADTTQGIRQAFPVIGSTSATSLVYAGGQVPLVGLQDEQSAFADINVVLVSESRVGGLVTVTITGGEPDWTGLPVTISGVADASYNGTFVVTTTGSQSFTYMQAGEPDSTSTGGTASYSSGGFVLYPMAEVVSVFDPATKSIDGLLTLAANTVPWTANGPVEEPHYFQEDLQADTQFFTQYEPRPGRFQSGGILYQGNNGPGLSGWTITNGTPVNSYFGNGGTHSIPSSGMAVSGPWRDALTIEAGENAAVHVLCNDKGCDRWNSGYDLFQMETSVGVDRMSYDPATSAVTYYLRDVPYSFTTEAFTAGTINVNTLNAGTINGQFSGSFSGSMSAESLPVFGASGPAHAPGAVPDPGATAGTTRFLREDGTFAVPAGGAGASAADVPSATIDTRNGQQVADAVAGTTMYGGVCLGDSLMYGAGATVPANGMCQLIGSQLNLSPMNDYAVPGDTAGDLAWQSFTYLNPADTGNPVAVAMIGGNDAGNGAAGITQFQQNEYAAYAWAALPASAKVPAGSAAVTRTGTWSAETSFANANGLSSGAAGSTLSFPVQAGPGGAIYVWYEMRSGGGSFTATVDGAAAADSVTGLPTISTATVYAANQHAVTVGLARLQAAAGSHTVVLTGQPGVTVLGLGMPPTTRLRGSSAPKIVMGGTSMQPQWNPANVMLYNAASLAISKQLVADGLNVPFADVLNGDVDPMLDFNTSATQNCPASTNTNHPNDCGHRHYAGLFEAQLNVAPTVLSGTGGLTSPFTAAGPFRFNYGTAPQSTSQFTSFRPPSYTNGLLGGIQLCSEDDPALCGLKPQLFGFGAYGLAMFETDASKPLGFCWGANGNPTSDAQFNCPVYVSSDGTVHASNFAVAGVAPNCGVNAAAGTGASCTVGATGTPKVFVLNVTTGTGTTASGTLAAAYFTAPLPAAPVGCSITPRDDNTLELTGMVRPDVPTASYVSLHVGPAALPAGQSFSWTVMCP